MRKLSFYFMIMMLSLIALPINTYAAEKNPAENPKEVPAEVRTMLNRLNEIKEMDKSNLSSSEKKELRTEVKTIKKNLKATGHGVYLSVGAIIIIILLLILLL
ncbi:hypothetical protein [Flavobacterium seoulense]|uniref:Seryl-tRNA synthetase n=1 Tax=Flavobacterium seoulense TaxID=1492738 RepID=A0A066WUF3_9FLAO|nr:hypothetical protein [Flavobacterium seoulense]KDN54599.1 hypothetical protein FEM21_23220 [Flavobacterium seoulense]